MAPRKMRPGVQRKASSILDSAMVLSYSLTMRFVKIMAFSLVVALPCLSQTPTCAPSSTGLVGWWPGELDGLDAVGYQNGVLENGLTFAAGEVSQAFLFNTPDADLHVLASAVLDVGVGSGFTLEVWINPSDVEQTHPLLEWNDGTFWGVHFHIAPGQPFNDNPGPGELYANIVDSGGGWHQLSSPGGTVLSNVFQHVALTYDQASGLATIYRDGQIVGQGNLGSFTPLTSRDLYLGRRVAPSGEACSFAGLMDEASIYNRALSQSEIQAIYNAGSSGKCAVPFISGQPQGQVGYWGGSVSFIVRAAGAKPLTYLWSKDNALITGATNSILVLTNLSIGAGGNYSVVVSNSFGWVTSSNASLTVNPAGVSLGLYPGLSIQGTPGRNFGIQYTTNLRPDATWLTLTQITLTQPVQLWTDLNDNIANGVNPRRYYRVVPLP